MKMLFILLIFNFVILGYDLDTNTIETLVIFREHELIFETDTIESVINIKSGKLYYCKGLKLDYWSDKQPILLKRVKK